jgi:hypothetical protein
VIDRDEFYIGYEAHLPPRIKLAIRWAVACMATCVIGAAALFVVAQRPLAQSRFDYGAVHEAVGLLVLDPAPALLVETDGSWERYWLVSRGKHGAARAMGATPPGWVRLEGTRIERTPWQMLEVADGSVRPIPARGDGPPVPADTPMSVTLRGEVVDSKCFLGVMNPGERTVHRDCAIRCLAGGIAPMFSFENERGAQLALLLGRDDWSSLAGRTVELRGTLRGPDTALVFAVDAAP